METEETNDAESESGGDDASAGADEAPVTEGTETPQPAELPSDAERDTGDDEGDSPDDGDDQMTMAIPPRTRTDRTIQAPTRTTSALDGGATPPVDWGQLSPIGGSRQPSIEAPQREPGEHAVGQGDGGEVEQRHADGRSGVVERRRHRIERRIEREQGAHDLDQVEHGRPHSARGHQG